METVANYYTDLGYKIQSVEADKVGWDLTATLGKRMLKLEVKGLSDSRILADLTVNEYGHFKADKNRYRLCIVTSCLIEARLKLHIFQYSIEDDCWLDQDGNILRIEDRIAARVCV